MRIPRWFLAVFGLLFLTTTSIADDRPNILWICGEDLGTQLNQYVTTPAKTPNIDRLASMSLIYRNAWSNAPVCAPARTSLLTSMYCTSIGAEHMRSMVNIPEKFKHYPQILKEAGYDTTNRAKTDYNVPDNGQHWSSKHDFKNVEQPFYMKVRFGQLHESSVGHARAQVKGDVERFKGLPAFHPDIPEMHRNWATYFHRMEQFDVEVGRWLEQLEDHDLLDNTIIVLWGDHGPGIPFGKRFVRNFGLNIPVFVYVPEKFRESLAPDDYKPGGYTNRLISFVDFGPTMLSLAGIKAPAHMQGRAFMGEYEVEPRQYIFGFRGRMDERIDMMRTVRDKRYQLIRNYLPHRPYGQYLEYLHRNDVMDKWKSLTKQGKIGPPASLYWHEKPAWELYDIEKDPDQVMNLAYDPEYRAIRQELTRAMTDHQEAIGDVGFLTEWQINSRTDEGQTIYEWGQKNKNALRHVRVMAEVAADRNMESIPQLLNGLKDDDDSVRYWAATGFLVRGQRAVWPHRDAMRALLNDAKAPTARAVASEALAKYGNQDDRDLALTELLELANPQGEKTNAFSAIAALNAIDELGPLAMPLHEQLKALPKQPSTGHSRTRGYTARLLQKILKDMDASQ